METTKPSIDEIADNIKEYINTSAELYTLKASAKAAKVTAVSIVTFFIATIFATVLIFVSLALAFTFAQYFNSLQIGFFMVAFIYLFAGLIIMAVKKRWLIPAVTDILVKSFNKK
jgi:hypothetical protein